jgi:hypothetical protein
LVTGTSSTTALREVGGGAAQNLVLHLQPALVTAQLDQLGLLSRGLPVHDAVVDVGLADPAAHGLHRHVEVSGDLGLAQVTAAGDPHDVTLELGRELLRHSDILYAGPRPTEAVSTHLQQSQASPMLAAPRLAHATPTLRSYEPYTCTTRRLRSTTKGLFCGADGENAVTVRVSAPVPVSPDLRAWYCKAHNSGANASAG